MVKLVQGTILIFMGFLFSRIHCDLSFISFRVYELFFIHELEDCCQLLELEIMMLANV